MSIALLVPSRGRPERARDMVVSVHDTRVGAVRVIVIVDEDDPTLTQYERLQPVVIPAGLHFTGALNRVAREVWDEFDVLGAFGDDVLFRTPGWDLTVAETLATPGIAYGDDLIHGVKHPSAVFMSSVIARALGWLALPVTSHQWADDGWKRLGQATGLLRYMPSVIVEHMHPAVGKAEMDDGYRAVFESNRAEADHEGFVGWLQDGSLEADAERVRAVR